MANNDVYAGALMPKELEKRARILAAKKGISRSKLFRLALENYLALEEKVNESDEGKDNSNRGN